MLARITSWVSSCKFNVWVAYGTGINFIDVSPDLRLCACSLHTAFLGLDAGTRHCVPSRQGQGASQNLHQHTAIYQPHKIRPSTVRDESRLTFHSLFVKWGSSFLVPYWGSFAAAASAVDRHSVVLTTSDQWISVGDEWKPNIFSPFHHLLGQELLQVRVTRTTNRTA